MSQGQLILILAANAGQYRRAAEALDAAIKAIEACDPPKPVTVQAVADFALASPTGDGK
jgi:hypothetical protein